MSTHAGTWMAKLLGGTTKTAQGVYWTFDLDTNAKRILELNPQHPLIARLAASVGETGASEQLSEFAWLLLDQARIVEGEQLPDPPAFARRLASLLERGLPAAA